MTSFQQVRELAREFHDRARRESNGSGDAQSLLQAASTLTGIECEAVPPNDAILQGAEAVLKPDSFSIFYKDTVPSNLAAFYQSHEFGHYEIDKAVSVCTCKDINLDTFDNPIAFGLNHIEGYSLREKRECQANVFAREFLLPSDEARRLFINEKMAAETIASQLGLPINLVYHQIAQGILIPNSPAIVEETKQLERGLDQSQAEAAEAIHGPILVDAGPGTGKTHTLTSRIIRLIKSGVSPNSILALTFSNRAAEELRDRVLSVLPDAAVGIWSGTFHSFGLELLRKYGHIIDIKDGVKVLDPSQILQLLESKLASLPLENYLNLYEPAYVIRDIQDAISRAKDELLTPARYLELGQEMLEYAEDEKSSIAAYKAIEVAKVYEVYEEILQRENILDFADLIVKPVTLLGDYPNIRSEIINQYQHVLIDEYQDVNRASGIFLKLLTGDGKGLWVVGDPRQSIYRFRGASPKNIEAFYEDFPKAITLPLRRNYRSRTSIVRLIEAFASEMRVGNDQQSARWQVHRNDKDGIVTLDIAEDQAAEAVGISEIIKQKQQEGVSYREQAVLCRTHNTLAQYASLLEKQGIPVLYLGNLFERPEICDLLSLISFTCEPTRGGLFRIANFPEYSLSLEDVHLFLNYATVKGITPLNALQELGEVTGLTSSGYESFNCLREHLDSIDFSVSPAVLLSTYLFSRSQYLENFLSNDVESQQCCLAIYQLLQIAFEFNSLGADDSKFQFLQWIRRLKVLGDERQLRQLPTAASNIDAVRMLTIHASKGLQFSTVYLPMLGAGKFPINQKYNPCPLPIGIFEEGNTDLHSDEEECLFFVALSRACDSIHLSRAKRYGKTKSNPSRFLEGIMKLLTHSERSSLANEITAYSSTEALRLYPISGKEEFWVNELDQYLRCPRSYFYQYIYGLSGAQKKNAFQKFHRCVYKVLREISSSLVDTDIDESKALELLDNEWAEFGPIGHAYDEFYKQKAQSLLGLAVSANLSMSMMSEEWAIMRPNGVIKVRPDIVDIEHGKVSICQIKTGRAPKDANKGQDMYALLYAYAKQEYEGRSVSVTTWYLSSNERVDAPMSDKVIANRLKKYDDAIESIHAGSFPTKINDRNCSNCPQYFICPSVPETSGKIEQ